jgi:hypothetical protein
MPKLAIWSLFRESAGPYLERYQARIDALDWPHDDLRVYCVEGDSKDNTWGLLCNWSIADPRIVPIRHNVYVPFYGSCLHKDRLRALATVGNMAIKAIVRDHWADYACLIESDLVYGPDLPRQLIGLGKDLVSPMIWRPDGKNLVFYDIWAFRNMAGDNFPPNIFEWYQVNYPAEPFRISASGSVVMMTAQVLYDGVRYTDEEAVVGLCRQAAENGYEVWCDPNSGVLHPAVGLAALEMQRIAA